MRERIACFSRDQRDRLFHDEVARKAADAIAEDSIPGGERLEVILILYHVACDEGPSIDEDQSLSPYR